MAGRQPIGFVAAVGNQTHQGVGLSSYRLNLDGYRVNGESRPLALEFRATVGDEVELSGWALDSASRQGVLALSVQIDKHRTIAAQTRIPRLDLIPIFGRRASDCGFVACIATASLEPGLHHLFFVIAARSGHEWASFDWTLALDEPQRAYLF